MNVPFISSGALSRNHYALVRKVEESTSEGSVNRVLDTEVKSIREQLARPNLPLRKLKEMLIILLYCNMAAPASIFLHGTFDFALPHALSLAEAGTTIEDKRTGYLFCAEMMEPNHEMRLMLVNTLRKDLEHGAISRICLALDNIILTSSAHVIPAIQRRLYELLSHNHLSVRRRAFFAARALSKHEPDLLVQVHPKILKRIRDPDLSVTGAALRVAETLFSMNPELAPAIQDGVNDVFESCVQAYSPAKRGVAVVALEALRIIGLRILSLPAAFDLLMTCSSGRDTVVTVGLYRLFKAFDQATLHAVEEQAQISLVGPVRGYLTSRNPNETYLFLSCLECVDTRLWAGTSEVIPAVLEAWEVEQIMQFLDSNDDLIRKKTLHLLGRVDEGILNAYYSRAISVVTRVSLPLKELNARTKRLLEILEVVSGENGELYAGQIKRFLSQIETHVAGNEILDSAVEGILLRLRVADPSFQVPCAATMLALLCDKDVAIGPTMMIIVAALATEYSRLVSLSPVELLSGICHRLIYYQPIVQEPCLLAMLRVAADCEVVPKEITQKVTEAGQNASRHIRRRCDQFLTLTSSSEREVLLGIVNDGRSLALPDFLEALETHSGSLSRTDGDSNLEAKLSQGPAALSQTSSPEASTSKLRYEAYDAPQAIPGLRAGRPLSSQRGISGYRSQGGSINARLPDSLGLGSLSSTYAPTTSVHATILGEIGVTAKEQAEPNLTMRSDVEALSSRVDLIALDSPFMVESGPTENDRIENESAQQTLDFESIWNSDIDMQQSARGWYDAPMDEIVRRLQGINRYRLEVRPTDIPPFVGDLKIMILTEGENGSDGIALLRLKDSDEDTSLWRLRCNNVELRDVIQQLLANR